MDRKKIEAGGERDTGLLGSSRMDVAEGREEVQYVGVEMCVDKERVGGTGKDYGAGESEWRSGCI